jgi:acetate---CoA ligase (ADP-forming)
MRPNPPEMRARPGDVADGDETSRLPVSRLLRPRSIAVVGISPERGSVGATMLSSLESVGYGGAIHLVSRRSGEAFGRRCVPAIDDLPMDIDLAVLCLPRAAVHEAVAACGRRRIGGAIVFAAGFAETGEAGAAEQRRLAEIANRSGVAMLGPNCLGFINHLDGAALCMSLPHPRRDADPSVAFLTQSGAMMLAAADMAWANGIGFTFLVSTGNEAVIGVEDFLAAMIEDAATRIILLFIEEIRRPRAFLRLARQARERKKPIVMFHSGRTLRARAAAHSHTGALAGDFRVMAALTAHEGVILVDSFDALFDVAALLSRHPHPPTKGVGLVTNSGAFRGITFDVCAEEGLDVPALTRPTLDRLAALMPDFAAPDNPLDVGTQLLRQPELLGIATQALLDDPNVGSVVVAPVLGSVDRAVEKARSANAVLRLAQKPAAFAAIGGEAAPAEFFAEFASHEVVMFRSPERALRALARITDYGLALRRWDERSRGCEAVTEKIPPLPGRGMLSEHLGKAYLAALGIAVPAGGLACSADDAAAIAAQIGFPVVLKAQAKGFAHKSDCGGVMLAISDQNALRQAWGQLRAQLATSCPDLRLDGVLVERMSPPGLEFIVGARRDPAWGPVVAVGLGGVLVETLDDVRLMAPDVTEEEIKGELRKLRGAKLLEGARGAPPVDVAALAAIVAKIGALMRENPDLIEIDLNPVTVYERGAGACALDALLVVEEEASGS